MHRSNDALQCCKVIRCDFTAVDRRNHPQQGRCDGFEDFHRQNVERIVNESIRKEADPVKDETQHENFGVSEILHNHGGCRHHWDRCEARNGTCHSKQPLWRSNVLHEQEEIAKD